MPQPIPSAMTGAIAVALALAGAAPVAAQPRPGLSAADQAAAFRAAGFRLARGKWRNCDDPGTAGYAAGAIEQARDVDGDGLPDAVVTEGSTFCFGMTGTGFAVVSKQPGGAWKLITQSEGVATFLPRRAAKGWPDLEIGGPGFCFPVHRWNGRAYVQNRYQYQGRPCRPPR